MRISRCQVKNPLLPIPEKHYFTIGEVSRICGVAQHVLRYWEKVFPELKPAKRRGARRYYQRQDIYLIRQIHDLLHRQGYTISGARRQLSQGTAKAERVYSKQLIAQLKAELEEVITLLKE